MNTNAHKGQKRRGHNQYTSGKLVQLPGSIKLPEESKYKKCPPFPKSRLSKFAKLFWDENAKRLWASGRLNRDTRQAFEMLCAAYGRWIEFEKVENERRSASVPAVFEGPSGEAVSKAAIQAQKSEEHFYKIWKIFVKTSAEFEEKGPAFTGYGADYD